jgi:nucleoside-diphosphate-sugar epimerase
MDRLVLITGATGYVGSVLTPVVAEKYPVRAFDTEAFGNSIANTPNVEFVKGDIRDADAVNQALEGVTDVIHLAAIVTDDLVAMNESLGRIVNNDAFYVLCKLATSKDVQRIIYASSSSVYGSQLEVSTEEDTPTPMTAYAWTKLRGELIVNSFSDQMTVSSIRCATACGPAPRMRLDTVVNIFCKQAYYDHKITVHGGDQWRTNIHVSDVADLYLYMLDVPAERINGQVFNASRVSHMVIAIAEMVRERCRCPIMVYDAQRDNRSYRMSSKKLMEQVGWVAQRSIESAIMDNLKFFRDGGIDNPDSDIFYNTRRMSDFMRQEPT